jgi:predicted DNA-binding protein
MAQQPLDRAGGEAPKISVRLPRPQRERVLELAAVSGRTVSSVIRELVSRELERAGTGPPTGG